MYVYHDIHTWKIHFHYEITKAMAPVTYLNPNLVLKRFYVCIINMKIIFNQNVQIHGPGHVFGPKRCIHVFYMYVYQIYIHVENEIYWKRSNPRPLSRTWTRLPSLQHFYVYRWKIMKPYLFHMYIVFPLPCQGFGPKYGIHTFLCIFLMGQP